MSYTALYRKFRPAKFDEVKGQDHIVKTLKNQIRSGRIGHAYLFCGTRGTGKTTVAKIFAKAVNCERPVDGSPCGECAVCRNIASGTSMNVIEIDAASNNGVDNIRDIREEVMYSPTEGKYKVYIIDEVHMLSIGAFNALLKTLEEPPSYVIFILATTEAHKIPVTILSRCQRYDFKRITIDTIASRMQELLDVEHVQAEERAVRYIARAADGSMRDALSLLDQCIAFYLGQKLTYENVLEVLGAVDTEVFSRLFRQVQKRDAAEAMKCVDDLVSSGRDLSQFTSDFTWYLRNLLLAQSSDDLEDILDISPENLANLQEEAKETDAGTLIRYIRIFSELSSQMRYASGKRILLEVALIKLCRPQMETDTDSLQERIRALEEKIEQGIGVQPAAVYTGNAAAPVREAQPEAKAEVPRAIPEDVKEVVRNFRKIASQTSGLLKTYLKQAKLSLGGDDRLLIVMPDEMASSVVGKESNRQELESLIEKEIGKAVTVEVRHVEGGRRFEDSFVDIEKLIHMDIIIEDE